MNYKIYFALENKLKRQIPSIERSELVREFTDGSKSSLKELSSWEYNEFIRWMNSLLGSEPARQNLQHTPENRMRRKIIALFVNMGYKNAGKSDVERINEWCIKYGQFHKGLNEHTLEELTQLTTQVEKVYATFIDAL